MSESKVTTKKRSRKSTSSKKRLQPASAQDSNASAGEKQQIINQAAYFIAEQRGFTPGSELNDWLLAEARINDEKTMQGG